MCTPPTHTDSPKELMGINPAAYTIKDWDSDFFGFKIAEYQSEGHAAERIAALLDRARTDNVTLLVFKGAKNVDTKLGPFAAHVDRQCHYQLNLDQCDWKSLRSGPDIVTVFDGENSTPDLEALCVKAGQYSRFFADPVFPDRAATALYTAWMRASISKHMADVVFTARDPKGALLGIGAGKIEPNGTGRPTLMAVDDSAKGKGLGRSFVLACMKWMHNQGAKTARLTTQKRNGLARNTYKRMGWTLDYEQDVFHIWLKPPQTKARYF